jgi:TolA-binding protein
MVTLVACAADQASELFATAQFEERQHNEDHAKELYQELIHKYPASDFAAKAQARLNDLKK